MADIVNLRAARKARNRAEAEAKAAANRALYGRGKQQKQAESAAKDRQQRQLDGARIEQE